MGLLDFMMYQRFCYFFITAMRNDARYDTTICDLLGWMLIVDLPILYDARPWREHTLSPAMTPTYSFTPIGAPRWCAAKIVLLLCFSYDDRSDVEVISEWRNFSSWRPTFSDTPRRDGFSTNDSIILYITTRLISRASSMPSLSLLFFTCGLASILLAII